jgi:hypothetical protein
VSKYESQIEVSGKGKYFEVEDLLLNGSWVFGTKPALLAGGKTIGSRFSAWSRG